MCVCVCVCGGVCVCVCVCVVCVCVVLTECRVVLPDEAFGQEPDHQSCTETHTERDVMRLMMRNVRGHTHTDRDTHTHTQHTLSHTPA